MYLHVHIYIYECQHIFIYVDSNICALLIFVLAFYLILR